MSSPTAFDAFTTRLGAYTAMPVRFENERTQDLVDGGAPAWLFVEVYGDRFDQETMGAPGANLWIEEGVTNLHVMVPAQTGSREARTYANDLANLFREQPIGGLFMPEMSIGAGEPGKEFPNYWSMCLSIRWRRGDITSI